MTSRFVVGFSATMPQPIHHVFWTGVMHGDFALNIIRNAKDKTSFKTHRKLAAWSTDYFANPIETAS